MHSTTLKLSCNHFFLHVPNNGRKNQLCRAQKMQNEWKILGGSCHPAALKTLIYYTFWVLLENSFSFHIFLAAAVGPHSRSKHLLARFCVVFLMYLYVLYIEKCSYCITLTYCLLCQASSVVTYISHIIYFLAFFRSYSDGYEETRAWSRWP